MAEVQVEYKVSFAHQRKLLLDVEDRRLDGDTALVAEV
jgi:hypothetical protein